MKAALTYGLLLLVAIACSCGSSGDGSGGGSSGGGSSGGGTIDTDKLAGTPFEGATTGDAIGWRQFREGDYLTFSVDEVPIPVFLAYFTSSEEATIQDGIDIANSAIGYDALEEFDTWRDDARVIYKVNAIGDADYGFGEEYYTENPAITIPSLLRFDEKAYAATVACDWQIELRSNGTDSWSVAHELGHAFGIDHNLIDYENDTILDLEADSIMQGDIFPDNPQFNDYNYMMRMQGEILLEHLGEGSAPPE